MLNSKDRTQVILEKSGLSLSKFATILGKDRRTLAKFIENDVRGILKRTCNYS
ncbi:hypothetical protein ACE4MO_000354 [Campylobacter coli]